MLPALPEWHDPPLLKREKWPTFADALRKVQSPNGSSTESCPKAKSAMGEAQPPSVMAGKARGFDEGQGATTRYSVMAGEGKVVSGPPSRAMTHGAAAESPRGMAVSRSTRATAPPAGTVSWPAKAGHPRLSMLAALKSPMPPFHRP